MIFVASKPSWAPSTTTRFGFTWVSRSEERLNAENSAVAFDIPIESRTIFPLIGLICFDAVWPLRRYFGRGRVASGRVEAAAVAAVPAEPMSVSGTRPVEVSEQSAPERFALAGAFLDRVAEAAAKAARRARSAASLITGRSVVRAR